MPRLRQLLAPNPSPMTGPGTHSFLLGHGAVVVIDPGPAIPAHLEAILQSLDPGEQIVAILVTHPHLDHSALTPALARATGAEVMAFGPAGSARSPRMQELAAAGLGGGEGADLDFTPDRCLRDGEVLHLGAETLEVVHTPGHMSEHLAFGWGDTLFCGDHVMAWAPSLVSPPDGDMGAYLATLDRLLAPPHRARWQRYLPAHGAVIDDPPARVAALRAHRQARESAILAALAKTPLRCADFLPLLYAETPPALWPAAARNVLAHLIDLMDRQCIKAKDWPSPEALFSLP